MKDNEIIKALEICGTYKAKCTDCPAFVKVDRSNCKNVLLGALNLINSQKAEAERYLHSIKLLEKDVADARAETQKFKKMYVNKVAVMGARKFAERLKEKGTSPELDKGKYYNDYDIDRTLAEMESERE